MSWKLYALVSGGAFLATYLMSVPTTAPGRLAPAEPQGSAREANDGADIQELAARLQARVRAETSYREPGRDPFRFGARPRVERQSFSAPKVEAVETVPVAPPRAPAMMLSGIATDIVGGVTQRTAILSKVGAVLLVREGEAIEGGYRVLTIDDQSVTLEATSDGTRTTLRLAGSSVP